MILLEIWTLLIILKIYIFRVSRKTDFVLVYEEDKQSQDNPAFTADIEDNNANHNNETSLK